MSDRIIKWAVLTALTVTAIGALWASRADAQEGPPCAPTTELVAKLKDKYGEVEVGGGIFNEQVVVIPFASPGGDTWTILSIGTDGFACILSHGTDWFPGVLPEAPVDGERPA
jgi:hypothetical protein